MRTNHVLAACMVAFSMLALAACGTSAPQDPSLTASFSMTPNSGEYAVGDTFDVALMLSTVDQPVNTVDVVLTYDAEKLTVVDQDEATNGVQVLPGNVFEAYPLNDARDGEVRLGAASLDSVSAGDHLFATVTFKALKSGKANVTFMYEPGSHLDTDVFGAESVTDIMGMVHNGSYTITE